MQFVENLIVSRVIFWNINHSKMKFLKRAGFLSVIALLASCTSMPISTMIKMSRYDIEDYSRIDPTVVRMRITSNSDDPLVVEKTKLTIQLTEKNGKQSKLGGALLIESEQDLIPEKSFFSFGYQPEHVYVLKLDEEGASSFRVMGQIMRTHLEEKRSLEKLGVKDDRKGSLTLGASYDFRDKKEATLRIELLFNKKDDYFVLLNKVKFPPELNN
ncbi:MAG: hypothetical protein ACI9SC_001955 [Gammaproteobacteria bacterium]|jgi:hypothetical protein